MITAIEIENFKCIGERVRIEIAPITLLFGPNSAGKSSILQALLFAHEVLFRGDTDPYRSVLADHTLNLGGFQKLVHLRDLSRTIRIRLDFQSRTPLTTCGIAKGVANDPFSINDSNVWVEFGVKWSQTAKASYVSEYTVGLNDIPIGRISATGEGRNVAIDYINWLHPNLLYRNDKLGEELAKLNAQRRDQDEPPIVATSKGEVSLLSVVDAHLSSVSNGSWEDHDDEHIDISELPPECRLSIISLSANDVEIGFPEAALLSRFLRFYSTSELASNFSVGKQGEVYLPLHMSGCLPSVDPHHLPFDRSDFTVFEDLQQQQQQEDAPDDREGTAVVIQTLSDAFVGSRRAAYSEIENLLYVGGLREVPQSNLVDPVVGHPGAWAAGRAAWEKLRTLSDPDLDVLNTWLSEILTTGFHIERRFDLVLPEHSLTLSLLGTDRFDELLSEVKVEMASYPRTPRLDLIDEERNLAVEFSEVGKGISQIVPILVAGLFELGKCICIEQPETHLHQQLQLDLADLFTSVIHSDYYGDLYGPDEPRRFIIETHSEHLLLRLLRRIRESKGTGAPPGRWTLDRSDLAVNFIEKSPTGVRVRLLRIDKRGDFLDEWPRGFFEERYDELMAGR